MNKLCVLVIKHNTFCACRAHVHSFKLPGTRPTWDATSELVIFQVAGVVFVSASSRAQQCTWGQQGDQHTACSYFFLGGLTGFSIVPAGAKCQEAPRPFHCYRLCCVGHHRRGGGVTLLVVIGGASQKTVLTGTRGVHHS
jgi:hypothetical protein